MLQFFRFYKPTLLRTIPILGVAANRYVTGAGLVSAGLAFFSPEVALLLPSGLPEVSRWWVLVPLLALLAYGFLRALQERFEGLEEKLAAVNSRRDVKDLLANAVDEGKALQRMSYKEGDEIKVVHHKDVEAWVHHTHDLIEAAFDKGEARHFLNSEGYDPGYKLPFRDARHDPYKYHLKPRLRRLDELIVRANSLEVNPAFDPQDYKGGGGKDKDK